MYAAGGDDRLAAMRLSVAAMLALSAVATVQGQSLTTAAGSCYRFDQRYFAAADYGRSYTWETAIVRLDTTRIFQRGEWQRNLVAYGVDSALLHRTPWLKRPYWIP